ncbi:MAG: hypothetical protein AW09_004260 [Candidatus Accumulibacter phosphatis]|uniref:Uncharacterized protein n=1 Tax=Candidatus Accumulibacter phosphatis TaxID=327160 RepID=A0A080LR66_9PROT|nr:MAG: hypothetical protein AW09_004260 [Candidatus Accumulibacter phosphatis]
MFRRIPARGERQGDRERRAGNAEEAAEDQRLLVAVDAEVPGDEQRDDDDHLSDGASQFGFQVVNQHAHDDAQDGAGKHRRGDHHPFLCVRQAEILGDLHAQGPQHHPDHESQVEVEKSGQQGRPMPGLPEFLVHCRIPSVAVRFVEKPCRCRRGSGNGASSLDRAPRLHRYRGAASSRAAGRSPGCHAPGPATAARPCAGTGRARQRPRCRRCGRRRRRRSLSGPRARPVAGSLPACRSLSIQPFLFSSPS